MNHQKLLSVALDVMVLLFILLLTAMYFLSIAKTKFMRHYYASRAPERPKWFSPEIPKQPRHPGYLEGIFEPYSKELDLFSRHYHDGEWFGGDPTIPGGYRAINPEDEKTISKELRAKVKSHEEKLNKYIEQLRAWEYLRDTETVRQWRFFYADLMLDKNENR